MNNPLGGGMGSISTHISQENETTKKYKEASAKTISLCFWCELPFPNSDRQQIFNKERREAGAEFGQSVTTPRTILSHQRDI